MVRGTDRNIGSKVNGNMEEVNQNLDKASQNLKDEAEKSTTKNDDVSVEFAGKLKDNGENSEKIECFEATERISENDSKDCKKIDNEDSENIISIKMSSTKVMDKVTDDYRSKENNTVELADEGHKTIDKKGEKGATENEIVNVEVTERICEKDSNKDCKKTEDEGSGNIMNIEMSSAKVMDKVTSECRTTENNSAKLANEGHKTSKYVFKNGNETNENIENKMDTSEINDSCAPEEMISLPDTFFEDLMDVEFLGLFDVVDSWKQDDETADGKSDDKDIEKSNEHDEKIRSSRSDDKGRRKHDSDRIRSDRSSRHDRNRTHDYSHNRDVSDRYKSSYRRHQITSSKVRSERSRSHSKNESTSTTRSRRENYVSSRREAGTYRSKQDRSTSRSRKERSRSRGRREGSTSRLRKDRSVSKSRKERSSSRTKQEGSAPRLRSRREESASRLRKERSLSKSRNERSTSRSKREESVSRSRREGSASKLRNERSASRSRKERSASRSRKERSASRSRKERSLSQSRKKRSLSQSRKEQSPSQSRKERSPSQSRKERSPSQSRKEQSPSQSRKERSPQSRKEQSPSQLRKERSPPQSRKEQSPSQSRKERSPSQLKKERSPSRSKKERSPFTSRKENNAQPEISVFDVEANVLLDGEASKVDQGKEGTGYQSGNRDRKDMPVNKECYISFKPVRSEPPPPGLEDDIVPPGEEPLLIRNVDVTEKHANAKEYKTAEKINSKENISSEKNVPAEIQRHKPETEDVSYVQKHVHKPRSPELRDQRDNKKKRLVVESKQKVKSGSIHEELLKNCEKVRERPEGEFSSGRTTSSRKRSVVDDRPKYSKNRRSRSISVGREVGDHDRYRSRDGNESESSIDRDIRNFKRLRKLAKLETFTSAADREIDSRMREYYEGRGRYSSRERYKSPSLRMSLSPISLSPVGARYSRSRSRSRSHHRSHYRRRRSRSRSYDSLRSLSLSSLSSGNSRHARKWSKPPIERSKKKRKPFYEEITQKLGMPPTSTEHAPYQQQHEMQQQQQQQQATVVPFAGGPPMQQSAAPPMMQMPGYPVPQAPMAPIPPPNLHMPPPNLHLPPPNLHVPPAVDPTMHGLPAPQVAPVPVPYMQPQFMGVPPPAPAPMPVPLPVIPAIDVPHQPPAVAPTGPVFNVQPKTTDPSSLSGYLEATMKGEVEALHQPSDKVVRKAGEDSKLLSCVKPEVVARCEEAVAAVRAENALSMVPLGRVIVQPKAARSSRPQAAGEVSCFRSPLFDLSNPGYSFTTPPLHDFASGSLKSAARKLRRTEQGSRNVADGARKPAASQQPKCASVGVNTEISCVDTEWCCKCQAYNVGGRYSVSPPGSVARGSNRRRHGNSDSGSGDSDVQVIRDDPAVHIPPRPRKGILKDSSKPPESTHSIPTGSHPSRNPVHSASSSKPFHSYPSFPNISNVDLASRFRYN